MAGGQDVLVGTTAGDTRLVSNLYMITQSLVLPKGSLQVQSTLLPSEATCQLLAIGVFDLKKKEQEKWKKWQGACLFC